MDSDPTDKRPEQVIEELRRELRKREADILEVQKLAVIGNWEWDLKTQALYWSKEVYRIFGLDPDGFKPSVEAFEATIHPDDLEAFLQQRETMLNEKQSACIDHRILLPDGSIRHVQERTQLIFDDQNALCRVIGTVQDITDQREMELRLQENLTRLHMIFENTLDGILFTSPDGPIFMANQAACRMLDRSEKELCEVGRDLIVDEKDPRLPRALEERKQTGRFQGELNFKRRNGEVFPVDVSSRIFTLGDSLRACIIFRDISERKQAEVALKASEDKLRFILNHMPDMVLELDRNLKILWANKTALDLNPDAIGKSCYAAFPGKDSVCDGCCCAKVYETGKMKKDIIHHTSFRSAGESYMENICVPLKDAEGTIRSVLKVSRNVTDRELMRKKELQHLDAIRQVQKMEAVGTLAGGIAHDFNNMLGVITGNVSYALSLEHQNEEVREALRDALEGAKMARGLTHQLITFAKGGAPVKKVVNIRHLLEEYIPFALRGSKTRCNFHFQEDLWPVEIDAGQIHQVVTNLIINATQAMPEGGIIEIHVENREMDSTEVLSLAPGKYIRMTVADQGSGIAEDHLSRIFEPYFSTKPDGKGLGLAAVHSIIKNHGGHIEVESRLDKGTAFQIYLPATTQTVEPIQKDEKQTVNLQGDQCRCRLLIMDDQEAILKMAARVLNRMGYDTACATDGRKAIELFQEAHQTRNPFDIVILDLTVPGGMGGVETISELLKIDPGVKAIVSSGYSNDPIMSNYQEYGFIAVLQKPYTKDQLTEALNISLPASPSRRS